MIEKTYITKAKSWSEFSSSLNSLIQNNKKLQAGKIYEKCVQLFLQTDPKYQAALKNVCPLAFRENCRVLKSLSMFMSKTSWGVDCVDPMLTLVNKSRMILINKH